MGRQGWRQFHPRLSFAKTSMHVRRANRVFIIAAASVRISRVL
jgi:hypothetical protein